MMKQKPTIIYENTVAGSFVRRINRFTAEVLIDGGTELVHVKNTGRLRELLVPKAKVTKGCRCSCRVLSRFRRCWSE